MRHGTDSMHENDTIPRLFLKQASKNRENKIAMREKEYGIWRTITWQEYHDIVKYISLGLNHLGLQREEKVALIGHNRPEGLFAELGCIFAGGICVWLYQDCLLDEVKYIMNHSDSEFVFCEGQEEVDKLLSIAKEVPGIKKIIWDDPKGMRPYEHNILISLNELISIGKSIDRADNQKFYELHKGITSKDVALLMYTSGTTSLPKGVLLTHCNLLSMGKNLLRIDPCDEKDNYVSYLPFAWVGEQMMALSCGLKVGYIINFPEDPVTLKSDIREIGPQVMFAQPRVYEQMTREIQVRHLDASWLKRKLYKIASAIGYRVAEYKFNKRKIPLCLKWLYWAARISVLNKIKDHLGLSNVRNAYTGGAAMGPAHFRFFHSLGVNLKQIYGQTEVSGISAIHRNGDIKFDSVGKPIPETQIKITDEGEIITKSPSVFVGYYKDKKATEEVLKDGWLYSGDKGYVDESDHIVVFDRSKDIFTLNDGKEFSPQYLETRLKFSPYIKDSWVIGNLRPFVTAVICIDYEVAGKWADENKITYTSYGELSQNESIYELINKQISVANRNLPEAAKIIKFTNLYKEFDPDDDELTRTRKLRRALVEKRYKKIIDALYSEKSTGSFNSNIQYEDGRKIEINETFRIKTVGEY